MTELEKKLALMEYQELLRQYKRKENELQQLRVILNRQRLIAGVEEEVKEP